MSVKTCFEASTCYPTFWPQSILSSPEAELEDGRPKERILESHATIHLDLVEQADQKPILTVKKYRNLSNNSPEYLEIEDVLSTWKRKCYLMLGAAERHQHGRDGKYVVQDLKHICGIVKKDLVIKEKIKKKGSAISVTSKKSYDIVLVCRDQSSSIIQGIAVATFMNTNYVVIKSLATNPDNVRGDINKTGTKKIPGVGTRLIFELAKVCTLAAKKALFVKPLYSARGFYEKCGFEYIDSPGEELQHMILPTEKFAFMKEGA